MPYTPYKGLTYNTASRADALLASVLRDPKLARKLDLKSIEALRERLAYDYNQIGSSWFDSNWVSGYGVSDDRIIKEVMDNLNVARQTLLSKPQPTTSTGTQPTAAQQPQQVTAPTPTRTTAGTPARSMPSGTPVRGTGVRGTSPAPVSSSPTTQPSNNLKPFQFSDSFLQDIDRLKGKMLQDSNYLSRNPNALNPGVDWSKLDKYTKLPSAASVQLGSPTVNSTSQQAPSGAGTTTGTSAGAPPKPGTIQNILSAINKYLPTMGDALSAYGAYKGMKDAQRYTLENRATDTPNINPYAEYGARSLAENDNSFAYLQRMRANAKEDLQRQSVNAANQVSNNTLSNGTRQALLAANYADTLKGINDMNNSINTQEMSLMDRRSALLQDIDRMVMQGEAQRDLADRQDKDAYYTNLSRNAADYAAGLQHLGGMFNRHQENITNNNLLAQLSQYGFTLDPKTGLLRKAT